VSNTYCNVLLYCLSSSCVLCTQCYQFLWIVHSWLHIRYSRTFICFWFLLYLFCFLFLFVWFYFVLFSFCLTFSFLMCIQANFKNTRCLLKKRYDAYPCVIDCVFLQRCSWLIKSYDINLLLVLSVFCYLIIIHGRISFKVITKIRTLRYWHVQINEIIF
jgi:hypothetical protein